MLCEVSYWRQAGALSCARVKPYALCVMRVCKEGWSKRCVRVVNRRRGGGSLLWVEQWWRGGVLVG